MNSKDVNWRFILWFFFFAWFKTCNLTSLVSWRFVHYNPFMFLNVPTLETCIRADWTLVWIQRMWMQLFSRSAQKIDLWQTDTDAMRKPAISVKTQRTPALFIPALHHFHSILLCINMFVCSKHFIQRHSGSRVSTVALQTKDYVLLLKHKVIPCTFFFSISL